MTGVFLKATAVVHLFLVLSICGSTPSWTETGGRSSGAPWPGGTLQRAGSVFRLINASLDYWHAWRFCQVRFGTLTRMGHHADEGGALQLLKETGLGKPVWAMDAQGLQNLSVLRKQNVTFSALTFPLEFQKGFARVEGSFPALAAGSVCLWAQWDLRHSPMSTLFSYAVPVNNNEFMLRGCVDAARRVVLALVVHGHHRPFKASFANDGAWHHMCVTWRKSDGQWAIFVDGERRDSGAGADTDRDVHGGGIFVVGQDQDSFGGNFTEPFVGNVSGLSIWDVALEEEHVQTLSQCSALQQEPLFAWNTLNMTLHRDVKQVLVHLHCPGIGQREAQDCMALERQTSLERPHYIPVPCSQAMPFICVTSTERYLKMRDLAEIQAGQPSPFMHHLMQLSNGTMTMEGLIPQDPQQLSWDQVSGLLDVSRQALEETGAELEPSDVLSLVQLLARTADATAGGDGSRAFAGALSRQFLAVADRVISQEYALRWQAIKEIVSGPMAVVWSIDRMVTNLNPLLMSESDQLLIHGNNIRLEVQQKVLGAETSSSGFCGPDFKNESDPDCIEIPFQNIEALHNKGLQKLTLMNSWYGSLCPLFNGEGNITLPPIAHDGTQKYIGVVLGSSVISSMVLGEGRHINTAVRFRLRHRHQNLPGIVYDPICAFWDFNLMPEAGGGWSTVGCEVTATQHSSTSCYCNHTTNFALLLQVYEVKRSPENEDALQMLTLIGCGVSLCGLTFTFVLFVAVGVPKSDRTTVHKNLIVALGVAELLLMCSNMASSNQEVCFVVTALLHLFFMASFTWMLVEGLLLWSKVVSVNMSEDRRMKLYYAIGWGVPVVIVGVTLAICYDKYKADDHCWLNVHADIVWAFVGPVLVVLAVNTVVLWRVVVVTVSSARRRAKMLTPSSASQVHALDLTWAATRPIIILLPVLGLTWLFGVLVHLSMVLAYLFIALNAFQGLYIFLVYAVYNTEVRTAIWKIKEKRKALSFTNCSQPVSFLPSQRTANTPWAHHVPAASSAETSESSGPASKSSGSLVIKNESFGKNRAVGFSMKPAAVNQVVQLTAFKPSGC